jgi:hypothetical protein
LAAVERLSGSAVGLLSRKPNNREIGEGGVESPSRDAAEPLSCKAKNHKNPIVGPAGLRAPPVLLCG